MYFLRRYFDEGDGADTDPGADPNADPSSNKSDDKGAGDLNKDKSGKPDEKPVVEGKDKKGDEPTVESLTKQLADRDASIVTLKKTQGDQANEIGGLKTIQDLLKSNPQALLENIAAATGKTLKLEEKEKKVDLSGDDPPSGTDTQAAIRQMIGEAVGQIKGVFQPGLEAIDDFTMKQKHGDWDNLEGDRKGLQAGVVAGQMKWNEVFHLAAKGKNMAQAIDAAYAKGKTDGVAELQEQLDGSVDRPGARPKKPVKEEGQDLKHALKRMRRIKHS